MSKSYAGTTTNGVTELTLQEEGGNIGTQTIVWDNTQGTIDQVLGDIPDNWKNGGGWKQLQIGSSCTSIGSNAFYYCSGLTGSLTIPDSVTSIGNYAFYDCTGLSSLTIGNGVTSIGDSAFADYAGPNNYSGDLIIPDSVTTIGSNAFYIAAGNFDKLVVGSGVTSIGNYAFGYNLTPVAYASCPASAFAGSVAFYQCNSLTTLYARDAVANGYTLGSQSFEGTTLTIANWDNYPNPIPN